MEITPTTQKNINTRTILIVFVDESYFSNRQILLDYTSTWQTKKGVQSQK